MTKTELLEAILAELKAIHALLEQPADLPTPAEKRLDDESLNVLRVFTKAGSNMVFTPINNDAERY